MNFWKFIFSVSFLKQIIKAIVFFALFSIMILQFLKIITHHNNHEIVPEISGIELNKAIKILDDNNLRFEVIDSAKYNPNLPPFAVIDLTPRSGSLVKKDRKIYLTLNPSEYRKITVPNIIQVTLRNAESMLKAVGLNTGEISYVDNIGKNMVIEIKYQGNRIAPGSVFPKTTKIDLVIGNGIVR